MQYGSQSKKVLVLVFMLLSLPLYPPLPMMRSLSMRWKIRDRLSMSYAVGLYKNAELYRPKLELLGSERGRLSNALAQQQKLLQLMQTHISVPDVCCIIKQTHLFSRHGVSVPLWFHFTRNLLCFWYCPVKLFSFF